MVHVRNSIYRICLLCGLECDKDVFNDFFYHFINGLLPPRSPSVYFILFILFHIYT